MTLSVTRIHDEIQLKGNTPELFELLYSKTMTVERDYRSRELRELWFLGLLSYGFLIPSLTSITVVEFANLIQSRYNSAQAVETAKALIEISEKYSAPE